MMVGVIKLLEGYYLYLITERESVGNILGHNVFCIKKAALFQIFHGPKPTGDEAK